jgi:peptidoglycan/LPS O-acetylase OafA/YrhL
LLRRGTAPVSTLRQVATARPGPGPHARHLAGLDGIRALAVLGIFAFHAGLSSVPGGFYGVDTFFVLSGYLITSLLLTEWEGTGWIKLERFWGRRARRLFPALLLLLGGIGVVMVVAPRVLATPHMLGDALSTIVYVSNWYSIHGGVNYFAAAAQPSPLLHTWSLAIEEQFYLVWPLIVLAVLTLGTKGRGRRSRLLDPVAQRRKRLQVLFLLASSGALASALWMAHLAPDGYTTRAYYGTDTRAQALLIGAALATGLLLWKSRLETPGVRRLAGPLALVGLAGTGVLWATTNELSVFAFRGGFLVGGLAAGLVVSGAVLAPRGLAVRLLEIPPLPALGRISYGVYLWSWPVLLVMSPSRLHWGTYPLLAGRLGVTVAIAGLSAHFVEGPIRRGALSRRRSLVAAPAAAAMAVGLVFAGTLVPVGASSLPPPAKLVTSSVRPLTKVLVVGDSVAGSLGVGLSRAGAEAGVQVVNEGIPGCSLSMRGPQIKVLYYAVRPTSPCGPGDPDPLLAQWQKWVDAYNPDVVAYVARGETFDQEEAAGGPEENLGQAGFDSFVEQQYRQAIAVLGSRGATVVLMTTPYYDSGHSPSGAAWPEDDPGRVLSDDRLIRLAAGAPGPTDGQAAYVFDLNGLVSPGDHFDASVDGVTLRCTDGVHFTPAGGEFVGRQLVPLLAQLGRAHRLVSSSGAWPGPLPPATPAWYGALPC